MAEEPQQPKPKFVYRDQFLENALGKRIIVVTQNSVIINGVLIHYGRHRLKLEDVIIKGHKSVHVPWTITERAFISHMHPETPVEPEDPEPITPETAQSASAENFEKKVQRLTHRINGRLKHVHLINGTTQITHLGLDEVKKNDEFVLPEVIRRFETRGWKVSHSDDQPDALNFSRAQ